MTNEEKCNGLRAELARQDEQLTEAAADLARLNGGMAVPFEAEWLRELDEVCQAPAPHESCQSLLVGIRA